MNKKYVIFDFDGTLMNTNEAIIESWQATGQHYLGHGFDIDTIIRSFGETIVYTNSYLFPEFDPHEVHAFYRDYQHKYCEDKVKLFEGMKELMDELKRRGHILAVASSRTRPSYKEYERIFGIAGYFDVVINVEDVIRHKPDPQALELCIERLGAKKEDCIMLGDTRFDVGCANAAGVDIILTLWGHPVDMEQLAELGFKPDYIVNKPEEVLEIV